MTQTDFLILMVNGFYSTKTFLFGAAHGLKSWVQLESDNLVTFKETGVKVSTRYSTRLVMVRIQEAQCNLVIDCFYFIQEM